MLASKIVAPGRDYPTASEHDKFRRAKVKRREQGAPEMPYHCMSAARRPALVPHGG
jgi:hypothetical protein